MEKINGFRFRGQVVRHYRKKQGWTLKQLAAHLAISYTQASYLETGRRHCGKKHTEEAMELLDVPAWAWELPTRAPEQFRGYAQPKPTSTAKALRMERMWERSKALGATKEPHYPVYLLLPVSVAAALAQGNEEMSLPACALSAIEAFVRARELVRDQLQAGAP